MDVYKSLTFICLVDRKSSFFCHNYFISIQNLPNQLVSIHTLGNRIFVADIQESVHILRYKAMENQLTVFADDTCPRFTVATCLLDYSTVCLSDKFGNITIVNLKTRRNLFIDNRLFIFIQLRIPVDTNDDVEIDPTGSKGLWDRGLLNGASNKVTISQETKHVIRIFISFQCDVLAHFHVGEMVTSVQRAALIPGGPESIVYTTLSGSIGVLLPFESNEVC